MAIGRIKLIPSERRELERRARSRSLGAEDSKRAKLILLVAKGLSFSQICHRLDCTDRYISLWKRRFQERRLSGLDSRYRGSPRRVRTAQMEARILEATRQGPPDGTTHWSSYRLAKHLAISHTTVYRVWRQFGIQPHRLRRYMTSHDPEFEEKARTSLACILTHRRRTPQSSAWMKRLPSRPWIGSIRCCRSLQDGPNGMALSTTAMAPCRCTLRSTSTLVRSWARPARAIPAPSLSSSLAKSRSANRQAKKSMSLPIT